MNTTLQSGDDSDWNFSSSPFAQASWQRSYCLSICAMWPSSFLMHLGAKGRVGRLGAKVPNLSPAFFYHKNIYIYCLYHCCNQGLTSSFFGVDLFKIPSKSTEFPTLRSHTCEESLKCIFGLTGERWRTI